mmetsp:Transcript_30190/g.96391  ORF Transcript_30190/g.96391 Transcript_30190/m.96391 type:complete len:397 (-) Transcript_30190:125-1315(-)
MRWLSASALFASDPQSAAPALLAQQPGLVAGPVALAEFGAGHPQQRLSVLKLDNPLDGLRVHQVWRTFQRTGRHGWRRPHPRQPSYDVEAARRYDGTLFLAAAILCLAVHALLFQLPSSTVLHAAALAVWLAVAACYSVLLHHRHGGEAGMMWLTGYFLELYNAIENVCILQSITRAFRTPQEHARKVFIMVMLGQIIFQTVCFMGLAQWLRQFQALPYIVGTWMLYCAYLALVGNGDEDEFFEGRDGCTVRFIQTWLGKRFWPGYDEAGRILTVKDGSLTMSMLGPVVVLCAVMDCFLDIDMILTKIEEIPNLYIQHSSSVVASFALPELYFLNRHLMQRFPVLKYGLCFVIIFCALQMLLSEVVVVPASVSCCVMLSVGFVCVGISALVGSSDS